MKKYSNIVFLIVIFLFIGLFTKIVKNEELKGKNYITPQEIEELKSKESDR